MEQLFETPSGGDGLLAHLIDRQAAHAQVVDRVRTDADECVPGQIAHAIGRHDRLGGDVREVGIPVLAAPMKPVGTNTVAGTECCLRIG